MTHFEILVFLLVLTVNHRITVSLRCFHNTTCHQSTSYCFEWVQTFYTDSSHFQVDSYKAGCWEPPESLLYGQRAGLDCAEILRTGWSFQDSRCVDVEWGWGLAAGTLCCCARDDCNFNASYLMPLRTDCNVAKSTLPATKHEPKTCPIGKHCHSTLLTERRDEVISGCFSLDHSVLIGGSMIPRPSVHGKVICGETGYADPAQSQADAPPRPAFTCLCLAQTDALCNQPLDMLTLHQQHTDRSVNCTQTFDFATIFGTNHSREGDCVSETGICFGLIGADDHRTQRACHFEHLSNFHQLDPISPAGKPWSWMDLCDKNKEECVQAFFGSEIVAVCCCKTGNKCNARFVTGFDYLNMESSTGYDGRKHYSFVVILLFHLGAKLLMIFF